MGRHCRAARLHPLLDHDRISQHRPRGAQADLQLITYQIGTPQIQAAHLPLGGLKGTRLVGDQLTAHQVGNKDVGVREEATVEAEGRTRPPGRHGEAPPVGVGGGDHRGGQIGIGVDRRHQPLAQQGHLGRATRIFRHLQPQDLFGTAAAEAEAQIHHVAGAIAAGKPQGGHLGHGRQVDRVEGAADDAGTGRGAHLQGKRGGAGAGRDQGAAGSMGILAHLQETQR